jgi:hypothetical protein
VGCSVLGTGSLHGFMYGIKPREGLLVVRTALNSGIPLYFFSLPRRGTGKQVPKRGAEAAAGCAGAALARGPVDLRPGLGARASTQFRSHLGVCFPSGDRQAGRPAMVSRKTADDLSEGAKRLLSTRASRGRPLLWCSRLLAIYCRFQDRRFYAYLIPMGRPGANSTRSIENRHSIIPSRLLCRST